MGHAIPRRMAPNVASNVRNRIVAARWRVGIHQVGGQGRSRGSPEGGAARPGGVPARGVGRRRPVPPRDVRSSHEQYISTGELFICRMNRHQRMRPPAPVQATPGAPGVQLVSSIDTSWTAGSERLRYGLHDSSPPSGPERWPTASFIGGQLAVRTPAESVTRKASRRQPWPVRSSRSRELRDAPAGGRGRPFR